MRSVDTNVVLRALVRDNEAQAVIAETVLRQPARLLASVISEAYWVLKRRYRWSPDAIVTGLGLLLDFPTVECPDKDAIRWALQRSLAGADFPDMLHLALSKGTSSFATFDKRIARHADASVVPVETLG